MDKKRPIRVLVVDDSSLFREVLVRGLSDNPEVKVVATAKDPYEAMDQITALLPDVMICDVEMPRMTGTRFLQMLLPQYPLPVIVVSAGGQAVLDGLHAGAVDYMVKPNLREGASVAAFVADLALRIKAAYGAKIARASDQGSREMRLSGRLLQKQSTAADNGHEAYLRRQVVAIGASLGGTEAVFRLLVSLPAAMPGIVIVQHMPPVFSSMFASRLDAATPFMVKEAVTGDKLEPGRVLIAPGDRHVRVIKKSGGFEVECFAGEKVSRHCPSVDVLFESVAREAGAQGIGVILTGMGYDGAKGLLALRRKGGRTLGQDQASSVVYGMPKAAYDLGAVQEQLPIGEIAARLTELVVAGGNSQSSFP